MPIRVGVLFVVFGLVLTVLAMNAQRSGAQQQQPGSLVAVRGDIPPSLDGEADDPIWARATPVVVRAMSMGSGGNHGMTDVTLKAAYTAHDLYVLAQWQDATASIDKTTWQFAGNAWSQLDDDEDRLAILWDLDRTVTGFGQMGCDAACHGGGGMRTNGPGERADQWQWKAARTNPMRAVDDQYLDDAVDPMDDEAAHHGDGGESNYTSNSSNDLPRWVWDSDAPSVPPGVPAAWSTRFLLLDEATDFGSTNPLTGAPWTDGDSVPAYALRPATGSRGDIEAHGAWADGGWTVEMRRALDTGEHASKDGQSVDQSFTIDGTYQFGVAVWDNVHGAEHRKASGPYTLRFGDAGAETPGPSVTHATTPRATTTRESTPTASTVRYYVFLPELLRLP